MAQGEVRQEGQAAHRDSCLLPSFSCRVSTNFSRARIFRSCSNETCEGVQTGLVVPEPRGAPSRREDPAFLPLWGHQGA